MVVHFIVTVKIVFLLVFIELVNQVERARVNFDSVSEKWAFRASQLYQVCDSLGWVFIFRLLGIDN
jgi:hypothetical protein